MSEPIAEAGRPAHARNARDQPRSDHVDRAHKSAFLVHIEVHGDEARTAGFASGTRGPEFQ
jgi:hypothetical protein